MRAAWFAGHGPLHMIRVLTADETTRIMSYPFPVVRFYRLPY
jgi:hypothetical protein